MKRRNVLSAIIASSVAGEAAASAENGTPPAAQRMAANEMEVQSGIVVRCFEFPVGDVRRYGAQQNTKSEGARDCTKIIQQIFDMTQNGGGRISFPCGDWSFYLDISLPDDVRRPPVIIDGNGSTFRCFSQSPSHSCVVYGNNLGKQFQFRGSNVQFENCIFDGRIYSDQSEAGAKYAVEFHGTSAVFYNCSFGRAKVAAFYGFFSQYNEFWSCMFGPCIFGTSSVGCVLESHAASASSNEVLFSRCKFFTCSSFLELKGCFHTRLRDCTFQGAPAGGRGGIILESDSTGQGTFGTLIDSCWFEDNRGAHIVGKVCESTKIQNNSFYASGGVNKIYFEYCYDLEMAGNATYADMECRITHAQTDTLTASLSWTGNNFLPTLDVDHSGPSHIDIRSAAKGMARNDNMLMTTGQRGQHGAALVQSDQFGFRTSVRCSTPTPLFRIKIDPLPSAPHVPVLILDLQLFVWNDSENSDEYASHARCQRFQSYISHQAGGVTVQITALPEATEWDAGTHSGSIGPMSMSATTSGASKIGDAAVTFSAAFPGGTSGAKMVSSATIGYKISCMGANPFTIIRL
jgi:hypothetical protein